MTSVRIGAFGPHRPFVAPGAVAVVQASLETHTPVAVTLRLVLLDVERVVGETVRRLRLPAGTTLVTFRPRLPSAPRHGYGLRLEVGAPGIRVHAASAIEALAGWWESPRHAALTDFSQPARTARDVAALGAWHVTVTQAYDWMWRHYRYEPPDGARVFRDALDRRVSHDAVQAAVDAGHAAGIATLAYGSVYGAEPEHVAAHPEDRVFDAAGEPLSLGGMFFINDVRPGTPWRCRLLGEYLGACRRFGFDGIHMDTYGPPHEARAADGVELRFADLYPGLIAEAARTLDESRPGTRVLFNCVEGFPLEAVAPTPAAALYLELWPPDDRYADLVRWVDRARGVADGRAVVIAAYVAALRDARAGADRAAAMESAVLLTSVLGAAGAYHHVLAAGDRLLVEGYYPAAVRMRAAEARELRAAWRFTARYVHLLSDPGATLIEDPGVELLDARGDSVPISFEPAVGSIWIRATRTSAAADVLQLVDLRDQADDRWTAGRQGPGRVSGLRVRWSGHGQLIAMSPWTKDGDALAAGTSPDGTVPGTHAAWVLPPFRRWLTVVAHPRDDIAEHPEADQRR